MNREPTEKQRAAQERNFTIFYFRGVYRNCRKMLDKHPEMERIMEAIDDLFTRLGADTEQELVERKRREIEDRHGGNP